MGAKKGSRSATPSKLRGEVASNRYSEKKAKRAAAEGQGAGQESEQEAAALTMQRHARGSHARKANAPVATSSMAVADSSVPLVAVRLIGDVGQPMPSGTEEKDPQVQVRFMYVHADGTRKSRPPSATVRLVGDLSGAHVGEAQATRAEISVE